MLLGEYLTQNIIKMEKNLVVKVLVLIELASKFSKSEDDLFRIRALIALILVIVMAMLRWAVQIISLC
jgi:hypothetical protein